MKCGLGKPHRARCSHFPAFIVGGKRPTGRGLHRNFQVFSQCSMRFTEANMFLITAATLIELHHDETSGLWEASVTSQQLPEQSYVTCLTQVLDKIFMT